MCAGTMGVFWSLRRDQLVRRNVPAILPQPRGVKESKGVKSLHQDNRIKGQSSDYCPGMELSWSKNVFTYAAGSRGVEMPKDTIEIPRCQITSHGNVYCAIIYWKSVTYLDLFSEET